MAYRNGTYIAFHAGGTTDPTKSDIKYYNLLKGWAAHKHIDFKFINSHAKTAAVRDTASQATLFRRLRERMDNSKQFLIFIAEMTKKDTDCVPYEIRYAIDSCDLPIIAAYPGYRMIDSPQRLSHLWPDVLKARIEDGRARVIHIPAAKGPLLGALSQFDIFNCSSLDGYSYYDRDSYAHWGLYP